MEEPVVTVFLNSTEGHIKQSARQEFEQIHRRGVVGNIGSIITGRQHRLLRLDEVRRNVRLLSRSDAGVQTVSIEKIIGSENRSADFDTEWRPLRESRRERWMNIAIARAKEITLPAIELVKVGDIYFVRDGHHRISVAKFQGQIEIEANIIEWKCADIGPSPAWAILAAQPSILNRLTTQTFGQLSARIREPLHALSARIQWNFASNLPMSLLRLQRPYSHKAPA